MENLPSVNEISKSKRPQTELLKWIKNPRKLPEEYVKIFIEHASPTQLFWYAKSIIKGRWIEAESVIRKCRYTWQDYCHWAKIPELIPKYEIVFNEFTSHLSEFAHPQRYRCAGRICTSTDCQWHEMCQKIVKAQTEDEKIKLMEDFIKIEEAKTRDKKHKEWIEFHGYEDYS